MKAFPSKQEGSYKYLGVTDGIPKYEETVPEIEHQGMDLRDYFAVRIVTTIINDFLNDMDWEEDDPYECFDTAIKVSYKVADAMMKARKQ